MSHAHHRQIEAHFVFPHPGSRFYRETEAVVLGIRDMDVSNASELLRIHNRPVRVDQGIRWNLRYFALPHILSKSSSHQSQSKATKY